MVRVVDNLLAIVLQGIITVVASWLTVNVIEIRKLGQAEKKLEIDRRKSEAEGDHDLGEAAQTLGATAVNLGESWQKYADRLAQRLAEERHAWPAIAERTAELYEPVRRERTTEDPLPGGGDLPRIP